MAATSAPLPESLKPMLALLGRAPFDSSDYLFELKWDGIRALAFVEGGQLSLRNRKGNVVTELFPELDSLPGRINGDGVVLDGEVVCLDELNRPSYQLLQRRLDSQDRQRSSRTPVHFVAFDLLYLGGRSVMAKPLAARKGLLQEVLTPNDAVQTSDFIESDGIAFFDATCDLGLEGIVAKERHSGYIPGKRSRSWLKIKRVRDAEFVIGGYTFGGVRGELFASLLLGLHDTNGKLIFVGQVSSGFSAAVARELYAQLRSLHTEASPFVPSPRVQKFIYWCRPELVCSVQYGEFTEDAKLAYPVFQGLRDDKTPGECAISDALGWPSLLAPYR